MKNFIKTSLFVGLILLLTTISADAQQPELVVQSEDVRRINSLVFSPDGKLLASGGSDGNIRLWDFTTGKVMQTLPGDSQGIQSLALSSDGTTVASASSEPDKGTVKLWDIRTGKVLHTFSGSGESWTVNALALSPEGYIAAGITTSSFRKQGFMIKLWDIHTGKELRTFTEYSDWINSVAFSPDGNILASGGTDKTIQLLDVQTGKKLQTLKEHSAPVLAVGFSPDGQIIASTDRGNTIKLWDIQTSQELHTLKGHSGPVSTVVFSPDGQRMASGSQDNTITLWDVRTGEELRTLRGHVGDVNTVAFRSQGDILVSGGNDTKIKLWNVEYGKELGTLYAVGHHDWVVATPDHLFDASPGALSFMHWVIGLEPIEFSQLQDRYYEPGLFSKLLELSAEPLRDVSALPEILLYPDVEFVESDLTESMVRLRLTNRGGGIGRVVVWLNGQEIMADLRSKDIDPQAQTLEVDIALSEYPAFIEGKQNIVEVKAYNAEGTLGSQGNKQTYGPEVLPGDVRHPELVVQTKHYGSPLIMAFSPNGEILASGNDEDGGNITLWNLRLGRPLHKFQGHAGKITSIAFTPDGNVLATAGQDQIDSESRDDIVKLWDVHTGTLLRTLPGYVTVAFTPQGRIVVDLFVNSSPLPSANM